MGPAKLAKINAAQADKELVSTRHQELVAGEANVSATILSATTALIKYLEGQTTKTEVVNQLQSISTPDVKYVVEALQVLDATLRTHENVDLSGVTQLMQQLVEQARLIPKELPIIKDQHFIDYTSQLSGLTEAIQAVQKVVENQKLVAEAPVVNVPKADVHVDVPAPDLEPLQQGFKDVVTAVKKIVIPEYRTDNTGVEVLLTKANKLLDKILKKPISSGGGGGGSSWVATNSAGIPMPLTLDPNGNASFVEKNKLVTVQYDGIYATYPTAPVEVYTYKAGSTTVATVTVTYTDSTKTVLTSVVKS